MNILDYWIKEVQAIAEFQAIAQTEDAEFVTLGDAITDLINDQFIETATTTGIARREKMLDIQPFNDDTIETRRTRIELKWNTQLPYTIRQLNQSLISLLGEDGYTITLVHGSYTMEVRVELKNKRVFDAVQEIVEAMTPANILLTVILRYNQHSTLANYTHAQLSAYTHKHIRNEVLT